MGTGSETPRADRATDVALSALLGLCATCWCGLVAGQLGIFRFAPIALIGCVTFVATLLWTFRRWHVWATEGPSQPVEGGAVDMGGRRWRTLDGPLVFLVAAVLYLPGYDVTLYGSDATVYWGVGAHLARHGALAIDDDLIGRTPWLLRPRLFPPYSRTPESPRRRAVAGLAFARGTTGPVYSMFSQLPSVWLAMGFAVAGLAGALIVTPLLAAGGIMMFYLFVRRASDVPTALLAAGLLATALPQIFYARLPMGEAGGQLFLWGGLLALSRWDETRVWPFALAAGAGFGLAALARPEYLLFVPLAFAVDWLLGANRRHALSPLTAGVASVLFTHAVLLMLFFIPTHYRVAIAGAVRDAAHGAWQVPGTNSAVVLVAIVTVLLVVCVIVARHARRTGSSAPGTIARALTALALVTWGAFYVHEGSDRSATGITHLPLHTSWPIILLAAIGCTLVAHRWWSQPAGRVALLIGVLAALHFFYDAHTRNMALWSARRLVPAALPLLFVSAAAAVGAIARSGRAAWIAAAALALVVNAMPARQIWGKPYFEGTEAGVSEVAGTFPAGAVVLIDGGLLPALLDVPLWLMHDVDALQLRGKATAREVLGPLVTTLGDTPVYIVRHAILPEPRAPGMTFSPAGTHEFEILLPGAAPVGESDVEPYLRFDASVFRVERTRTPATP